MKKNQQLSKCGELSADGRYNKKRLMINEYCEFLLQSNFLDFHLLHRRPIDLQTGQEAYLERAALPILIKFIF